MALSDDVIRKLENLVCDTTALVYVDGKPNGTAFFISEDLLLTCGHVVPEGCTVTIQPYRHRNGLPAEVRQRPGPDLALLRVTPDNGEPSPCVVLGLGFNSQDDCLAAGYPDLAGAPPGYEARAVKSHWRTEVATGDPQSLVIDPGQNVTYGMSGSPVVSTETGTVVAIVRTSKDPRDALGGSAIPISLAAEALPEEVGKLLETEIPAMKRWRDALGKCNWQRLDRSWDIANRIDLWITGNRMHWKVRLRSAGGRDIPHKGPKLGDGVAKAIFHWAQRGTDEVRLLGQLLARALFPGVMPPDLKALSSADSLLVCLHVPPGNDLADIPWELAADPFPQPPGGFLAADLRFRFIRIAADGAGSPPPPRPMLKPPGSIRVLSVVAQPAGWVHLGGIPKPTGGRHDWPDAQAMRDGLRASVARRGVTVTSLVPPLPIRLEEALRQHHDVLHYMGTGWLTPDGPKIVFANEKTPDSEQWDYVHNVLDTASQAGVRLVVLELLLPPEDKNLPQLTCSAFGDVIARTRTAMVLTNLPVYPDQCKTFNDEFYRCLSDGDTIEAAVQKARHNLKKGDPTGDPAGFGWFTVITGGQTGIRLVEREARDPNQPGPRVTEPPAEGTGDVRYR
jgi:Trypsin-like peptidase domain